MLDPRAGVQFAVRDLLIPVAVGVAVAFAWMGLWYGTLRAFGMPVRLPTLDRRVAWKQSVYKMGKLRYILVFGVLGGGVAHGLAITTAVMMSRGRYEWGLAAVLFAVIAPLSGYLKGLRGWNALFQPEVPFPPHYPPSK